MGPNSVRSPYERVRRGRRRPARNEADKMQTTRSETENMRLKVEAHDRLADAHGTFCRSTAAKMLGVPPQTLTRWLRTNGWTFRRPGDKDDIAYQAKIGSGLLEHKIATGLRSDGSEWISTQVRVTPKGMTVLAKALQSSVSSA